MDMNALNRQLSVMSLEDLTTMNRLVVQQIRWKQDQMGREAKQQFRIGQYATFFSSKRGRQVRMIVEKINPTTIAGRECSEAGVPGFMTWRVHPTLLSAWSPIRAGTPLAA